MAAFSGVSGSVMIGPNHVADVTHWRADHESVVVSQGDSASGGWTRVWVGLEKIVGSFDAKLQAGLGPPVTVGNAVNLILITGGGLTLRGQAVITRCTYDVDIDAGKASAMTAEYASSGPWYIGL